MRRRPKFRLIAAILGVAALGLGAGGCGGDGGDGSIGERDAARLLSLLEEISADVDSESCDTATAAAGSLEVEVTNLTDVPEDVVDDLLSASERLQSLVVQECGPADENGSTSSTTSTREQTSTSTMTTTTTATTTEPTTTTTTSTTNTDTDGDGDGNGGDGDTGGTQGAGGTVAPTDGDGGGD